MGIQIEILEGEFSVCKVPDFNEVDISGKYVFTGVSEDENSLICPSSAAPGITLQREDGWRAFRLCGSYDFSLIGILAGIAGVLASEKIPIMAVSTYNTDYVLVKKDHFDNAVSALKEHGYEF